MASVKASMISGWMDEKKQTNQVKKTTTTTTPKSTTTPKTTSTPKTTTTTPKTTTTTTAPKTTTTTAPKTTTPSTTTSPLVTNKTTPAPQGSPIMDSPLLRNKVTNRQTKPETEKVIVQAPVDTGPSIADLIKEFEEARRQQLYAQLDKSYAAATSSLDEREAGIAPQYYDARNRVAAQSDVGALNFAQYMAGRGVKGSAGTMPEIYRNAAMQGNIGALNQQEQAAMDAVARDRSGLAANLASDRASADAGISAEGLQAYINQMNADRMFGLQEAGITGQYSGSPTLAAQNQWFNQMATQAQLTGTYGGQQTLAAQQFALDKALQEAGLTGTYNGQQTLAAQNQAFNQGIAESGVTGQYNGQPTFDYQKWEADENYRNKSFDEQVRQFNANYGINLRQMSLQETQQQLDQKYRQGQLSLQQAQNALSQAKFTYEKQQNEKNSLLAQQQQATAAQKEAGQAYNQYMQTALGMMTAGNYNSYTGTTDKQYTNQQVLAYINSLPITAQEKANMANNLSLY